MRPPLLAVVLLSLLPAACGERDDARVEVTVSAASSLQEALAAAVEEYRAERGDVEVRLNFGASGALQQQIERGAPVDLFLSAAQRQMDELERNGRIDPATRRDFTSNELVLVTPLDATAAVADFADLAEPRVQRVAIGAPASVPAGAYADEVLRSLGIAASVLPKALRGQNVRQVLTYVEMGEVQAGIVYRTDAAASDRVSIVATAPPGTHSPITYPLAVVAGSDRADAALDLARFILGPRGQAVLARFGFRPPAP
jgi:molybdate transport system substrate-binding protein